jgi:hypothetical protein
LPYQFAYLNINLDMFHAGEHETWQAINEDLPGQGQQGKTNISVCPPLLTINARMHDFQDQPTATNC